MRSVVIRTAGMHCHACEMNVQDTVSELEGVKKVRANFNKGEVLAEFDETKTSVEQIKAKIGEAGYKPE